MKSNLKTQPFNPAQTREQSRAHQAPHKFIGPYQKPREGSKMSGKMKQIRQARLGIIALVLALLVVSGLSVRSVLAGMPTGAKSGLGASARPAAPLVNEVTVTSSGGT